MNSKIGIKLLTSYFLLVIITLVIAGSLLSPLFRNYLVEDKKKELVRKSYEVIALIQKYQNKDVDEATFRQILERLDRFGDTRIIIVNKEGMIIAPAQFKTEPDKKAPFPRELPRESRLTKEEIDQLLTGRTVIKEGMTPHFNTPVISVAVPYPGTNTEGGTEVSGAVIIFSPVYLVTDTLKRIYYYLGISSVIALALAVVVAYFFSKRISLPVKNMNEAALAMAQGNYKTVIDATSDDELGELGGSLNYLARQLDLHVSALQQEKGKLESIVHSINEGLIAVDGEGKVMLINPMVEKIFMSKTERILAHSLQDVSPLPELTRAFAEVLSKGIAADFTFKLLHSTYRLVVAPIKQQKGALLGAVGILQDISEMEKVEQLRRDFIANVSHELRAPITVIRGYTECLLDGVIDYSPDHYYGIIRNETLRLERLILDLMDLSLLQSGKAELDLEEVNLSQLVHETVNKLQHRAKTQGIRLLSNTGSPQDITVYCDADRIEQLLFILLDNAIKYTPPEGVVEATLREEEDSVLLSIKDSGIGIPAEDLPFIWERFYKVDKSRNRKQATGTGLGLSIAKQIVDLHQAQITVESILGEGSTFTVHLKKG